MSAFLVADITINGFVTTISTDCDIKPTAQLELELLPKSYDLDIWADVERLAYDCFRLNMLAVDSHYGRGQCSEFRKLDFLPLPEVVSREQAYKSLGCLIYQCCEGKATQTPLFKALNNIKTEIAHAIICDLPAYAAAKWE